MSSHREEVYHDGKNDQGCPLDGQSGEHAVRNFAAIIAGLPPALRAAFEHEREKLRSESATFYHALA